MASGAVAGTGKLLAFGNQVLRKARCHRRVYGRQRRPPGQSEDPKSTQDDEDQHADEYAFDQIRSPINSMRTIANRIL